MYSINGIPLDNGEMGWVFRALSKPLSDLSRERLSAGLRGRDGVVGGLPATVSPVTLPLVVQTPKARLEALVALVGDGGALTVTDRPDREVRFETLSHSLAGYGPAEATVDATFLVRLPGVFWRSKAVSTFTSAGELVCWPGMSAPVQDAAVRVKGPATGVRVTDSSGAWVRLPDAAEGQWVRFDADTGRAYRSSTATWSGGTDVSGLVDFDGPRGVFEITPVMRSGPDDRAGVLTVSGGAVVEVRGKSAHAL